MQRIDGADGEGGGQIVRTALALALRTGQAITLERIRAGRPRPGLKRQHLAAVRLAAAIGEAETEGDHLDSQRLVFRPGTLRGGSHSLALGGAGSTLLVLQTVLPALLAAPEPSEVVLTGGTHNDLAPPFEHVAESWLPLLRRMGAQVDLRLERVGFAPAGGGRIVAEITPGPLTPLHLLERGPVERASIRALLAHRPGVEALAQVAAAREVLAPAVDGPCEGRPHHVSADGPGGCLLIEIVCAQARAVFCGVGRKAAVGGRLGAEAAAWLAWDVPVDDHLADQLVLPLALAGGGSFRCGPPTDHTRTQVRTVAALLPKLRLSLAPEGAAAGPWRFTVG